MAARLVFLTGSRAGTAVELKADVTVGRNADCTIVLSPNEVLVSALHATFVFQDGTYLLRDDGSRNGTFVNGEKVTADRTLQHGDLVQFGAGGPGGRFLIGAGHDPMPTLDPSEMARASALFTATKLSDRPSRESADTQGNTTRDLLTVAVRRGKRNRRALLLLASTAVVGIGAALIWQQRNKAELEHALAELSASLASERNSRFALEADIASFQARADSLQTLVAEEQRRIANDPRIDADAIRELAGGVALLVFTYGYAEVDGDRLLRFDVDAQGLVRLGAGPGGRPVPSLSFGGAGDPVQHQGTATGFLVDSAGVLLTNRHVAEPWARDEHLAFLRSRGYNVEGRFIDLRAYFPPGGRSYPLIVEGISAMADVAVARIVGPIPRSTVLPLSGVAGTTGPGDQLVLIAYPTGLHNLLYRVSRAQRETILQTAGSDARMLAAELASRRLIQPLITNGSISDTTNQEVIHTAAATVGASGGPLIDLRHGVVAIHYASLRSQAPGDPFQTQRGVPIRYAWEILPIAVRRALEERN
ncbi:FHA domain-containing protein [Gemmatimonadota bacterium]